MRPNTSFFARSFVVLLLCCTPALAEEPKSSFDESLRRNPPPETTIRGTVTAIGGPELALETSAGNRMEFEIDSSTSLASGVVSGSEVLVTYGPRDTGVNRVLKVELVKPPERPSLASATSPGAPRYHQALTTGRPVTSSTSTTAPPAHGGLIALIGFTLVAAVVALWFATRSGP